MKKSLFAGALAALVLASPAQAHKRWLLPSHSTVSEPGWITVDASVSNSIFDVERPFSLKNLTVTGPDGSNATVDNKLKGHLRSVFDVNLKKAGSYRIAIPGYFYFASYKLDGEKQGARGDDPDALLEEIPAAATQVSLTELYSRLETVVTLGAPSSTALQATGEGLEIEPLSHPNDLYTGETARWRLLLNGEPAADVDMELLPAGTRYRDSQQAWTVTSDNNGFVELEWPGAGRYYLEATATDDNTKHPKADQRRVQYLGTVEVLPL